MLEDLSSFEKYFLASELDKIIKGGENAEHDENRIIELWEVFTSRIVDSDKEFDNIIEEVRSLLPAFQKEQKQFAEFVLQAYTEHGVICCNLMTAITQQFL